ncbi:hypothetical protein Vi05172_g11796 [Venturia inaequalis]|nr:hypothetical protein Vi05172_g11796 [Venturia inaequalis]
MTVRPLTNGPIRAFSKIHVPVCESTALKQSSRRRWYAFWCQWWVEDVEDVEDVEGVEDVEDVGRGGRGGRGDTYTRVIYSATRSVSPSEVN